MVEPSQTYDLLIRNGRVIDPASDVDGVMDVAVRGGRIAKVAPNIAPGSAKQTVDAIGRLVIPGMIDTHAHVFEHVSGRFGLNPDLVGVRSGVTTVIDQGGPSCMTFPAFRKFIAEPADTRVLAFVSIYVVGGLEGHYYPALYGPSGIDVAACVRTAAANADLVKGIKGHAEPGGIARWGLGSLELASQAARETGLPLYIHLGQLWPPPDDAPEVDMDEMLPRIVDLMDEGDILAHPFTRHPGGFVDSTGNVHPVVREALARGLRIDVGHGSHFSFDMARRVLDAGILPYTLGADLHGYNTKIPAEPGTPDSHPDDEMHLFAGDTQFSLCRAMTELLALGVGLEDIVPMVTSHCATMIGMESELGSLAPGMPADISVLSDQSGEWKLSDNGGVTVTATRRVAPVFCVRAGKLFQADAPILPH